MKATKGPFGRVETEVGGGRGVIHRSRTIARGVNVGVVSSVDGVDVGLVSRSSRTRPFDASLGAVGLRLKR